MPIIEKREIKLDKMPFIVVVIDEMADLMMVAGKEVSHLFNDWHKWLEHLEYI